MPIIALPKNFYKAHDYALRHKVFHEFREEYEEVICKLARLRKAYKMSFEDLLK